MQYQQGRGDGESRLGESLDMEEKERSTVPTDLSRSNTAVFVVIPALISRKWIPWQTNGKARGRGIRGAKGSWGKDLGGRKVRKDKRIVKKVVRLIVQ